MKEARNKIKQVKVNPMEVATMTLPSRVMGSETNTSLLRHLCPFEVSYQGSRRTLGGTGRKRTYEAEKGKSKFSLNKKPNFAARLRPTSIKLGVTLWETRIQNLSP